VREHPAEDELFALVLYLVSCARLSLEEPVIYGSFRLAEGASRLIEVGPTLGADGELLREWREEIDREKIRIIDDAEGYRSWLDDFLGRVAAEVTRRNLEQPAP
jgi:Family of unknown function (DUF6092)